MNKFLPLLFLFLFIAGCFSSIQTKKMISNDMFLKQFQSFDFLQIDDDIAYEGLEDAILQSLEYYKRFSSVKKFFFGKDSYTASHNIKSLNFFLDFIKKKPSKKELISFIKDYYLIYCIEDNEILFTGYYEPFLKGSLTKKDDYIYPVYERPDDLITIDLSKFSDKLKNEKIIGRYIEKEKTVVPYYDRNEIDFKNKLKDKAKIIAWVKDLVDLFFLQIQGSGKIILDDGNIINVHYNIFNGRPYKSIGNILINNSVFSKSQVSMQSIKAYLKDNPDKIPDILNYNPSYVFFNVEKEGPFGCINTKLTAGRSIALDQKKFPSGALAFISSKKPIIDEKGQIEKWIDFNRFVLNQDTGGAIKGSKRADIFWGNGSYAETVSGYMKHNGKLYFLVLKPN